MELDWALSGCKEIRARVVCELERAGVVHLWVSTAHGSLHEPVSRGLKVEHRTRVEGGLRWRLTLMDTEGELKVSRHSSGSPDIQIRFVRVRPRLTDEERAHLRELLDEPNYQAQAEGFIWQLPSKHQADGYLFAAQAALSLGPAQMNREHQLVWLRRAEVDFNRDGRTLAAQFSVLLQGEILRRLGRYDESRAILRQTITDSGLHMPSHWIGLNSLAPVLRTLGMLRRSVYLQEEAERWGTRLNEQTQWRFAIGGLLDPLERLGDARRAEVYAARLLTDISTGDKKAPSCSELQGLASIYWWALVRAHGQMVPMGAEAILRDTLGAGDLRAQLEAHVEACVHIRSDVALNFALSDLISGRLTSTQRWLSKADAWGVEVWHQAWKLDLEGRMTLAQGRPKLAARSFQRMQSWAKSDPEVAWASKVGLGLVAQTEGEQKQALREFEAAESVLQKWPAALELGVNFLPFVWRRMEASRHLLSIYLGADRVKDAVRLLRRLDARAQLLLRRPNIVEDLPPNAYARWAQHLSEYLKVRKEIEDLKLPLFTSERSLWSERRERLWRTARTALAEAQKVLPLQPVLLPRLKRDDFHVFLYPGQKEWLLIGAQGATMWWEPLVSLEDDIKSLAEVFRVALLRRLSQAKGVKAIRVHAASAARTIDVHAFEWKNKPLFAHLPVTYVLDAGRRQPLGPETSYAMVLADPQGDLPAAREEARIVRNRLDATGWRLIPLRAQAGPTEILKSLAAADLFHYAGHGRLELGAHPVLLLSKQRFFTLSDVFSMPHPPRWVVLSGCLTGVGYSDGGATLGLGQAFMLAGSEAVLSTTRPVADGLARALAEDMYNQSSRGPDAWRAALVRLAIQKPDEDWAAYRIFQNSKQKP